MFKISQTEINIVDLLAKKDQKAIDLLYENYSGAIYGIILRTVKEEKAAEEVLQNVFLKVWKNADKYDRSKGRLFTWVVNIARNAAIDMVRSPKYNLKNKSIPIDANVINNNKALVSEIPMEESGAKNLIDSLDPKYKQVLDLVYLQGYSHQEAAKELGLPLGTLKTRIRNAIISIRNDFDRETILKILMLMAILFIITLIL